MTTADFPARPNLTTLALQAISLDAFYLQCVEADWQYTNDPSDRDRFKAGQKAMIQLRKDSELSLQHRALYRGFLHHHMAKLSALQTVPEIPEKPKRADRS